GTEPNMLDAHTPFEIDGNFCGVSGITEMLLQSHDGVVHILPALPDEWRSGEVTGLKARGGFTVDISWKDGKITNLVIHSSLGGNCRVMTHQPLRTRAGMKVARGVNPNPFYQVPGGVTPPTAKATHGYGLGPTGDEEYAATAR